MGPEPSKLNWWVRIVWASARTWSVWGWRVARCSGEVGSKKNLACPAMGLVSWDFRCLGE